MCYNNRNGSITQSNHHKEVRLNTNNQQVVPFGVSFMQPMPVLDASAMGLTRTHTHTGIGDSGQDSETDND